MHTSMSASSVSHDAVRHGAPEQAQQYAVVQAAALLFAFAAAVFLPPASAQTPVTNKPPGATTAPPAAAAKSFVTIGDRPAVMFDAPSTRANKTFIINPLTPLEVLVKLDKWTKVLDSENTNGWIENTSLGERRHVLVSVAAAEVRGSSGANATSVFDAQRGVVLEVTGAATADGWLPVKHRDGQAGVVRLTHVWGD